MKKEKFLCILENDLFFDEILVDFEGAPIFFTCIDNNGCYYAVVCSDFDCAEYLITKTTISSICDVLAGKTTIRAFFMNGEEFWKAYFYQNGVLEKIEGVEKKDVDEDVLPAEGEKFLLVTDNAKTYLQRMEILRYSNYEWKYIADYMIDADSSWLASLKDEKPLFFLNEDYKSCFSLICGATADAHIGTESFSNLFNSDVLLESVLLESLLKRKIAPSCELNSLVVNAA